VHFWVHSSLLDVAADVIEALSSIYLAARLELNAVAPGNPGARKCNIFNK
jgi:hypothetical protein